MLPQVAVVLYTSQDRAAIETHALEIGVQAVTQKNDIADFAGHLGEFWAEGLLTDHRSSPLLLRHQIQLASFMTLFIQSRKPVGAKVIIEIP
jgi:hypothetical protein